MPIQPVLEARHIILKHLGVLAQQSNAKRRFGSNFVND